MRACTNFALRDAHIFATNCDENEARVDGFAAKRSQTQSISPCRLAHKLLEVLQMLPDFDDCAYVPGLVDVPMAHMPLYPAWAATRLESQPAISLGVVQRPRHMRRNCRMHVQPSTSCCVFCCGLPRRHEWSATLSCRRATGITAGESARCAQSPHGHGGSGRRSSRMIQTRIRVCLLCSYFSVVYPLFVNNDLAYHIPPLYVHISGPPGLTLRSFTNL